MYNVNDYLCAVNIHLLKYTVLARSFTASKVTLANFPVLKLTSFRDVLKIASYLQQ